MPTVKQTLDAVHAEVLHHFTYETDQAQYHVEEKWVIPPEFYDGTQGIVGDCEDFALACRELLRQKGVNNSRLIVCLTEEHEGHCVLSVEGWILDNRYQEVMSNTDLPYKWVAMSGLNHGDPWHLISGINTNTKENNTNVD